jgi:hypothetical protein
VAFENGQPTKTIQNEKKVITLPPVAAPLLETAQPLTRDDRGHRSSDSMDFHATVNASS